MVAGCRGACRGQTNTMQATGALEELSPADTPLSRSRDDVREEIRRKGANINPESLLATDYLNHFNEIIMLFDLAADMPECFEDAAAWQPLSYEEHFARSNLGEKDLTIEAYQHSPDDIRAQFDMAVHALDAHLLAGIENCLTLLEVTGTENFQHNCSQLAADTRTYIDRLSAIIHGTDSPVPVHERPETETLQEAQQTIDSLFSK